MREIERFERLAKLVDKWLTHCALKDGECFMPDIEGDKIAKARTKACAMDLLRTLGGSKNED